MSKQHPNQGWVTRVIADSFETIQAHAPPEYLPAIDRVYPDRTRLTASLKGYGCGGYGCVIATADKGVVLKVTTDDTEVAFARDIEPTMVVPIGVEYYLAIRTRHVFKGNPVVLLWRESADDVGRLKQLDPHAWKLVDEQHRIAQDIYVGLHQGAGPDDMPNQFVNWRGRCEAMRQAPAVAWLAEGLLRNYDERGVFFGDVHAGNLGRVERDGERRWAITDPGHVAVLRADEPGEIPWPRSETAAPVENGRRRGGGCACQVANPGACRIDHADPKNLSLLEITHIEHEPLGSYLETRTCRCGATISRDLPEAIGETLWAAVNVPRGEWWSDRKVFISDVWRQGRVENLIDGGLTREAASRRAAEERPSARDAQLMAEWKERLVQWHRQGELVLSRADFVAAMDPRKVAASEVVILSDRTGREEASFHFIEVPPAPR